MTRIIGWLVVVGGNLPRGEGRRDVRTGRYRLPVAYISMRQIRGRDREIAPTVVNSVSFFRVLERFLDLKEASYFYRPRALN